MLILIVNRTFRLLIGAGGLQGNTRWLLVYVLPWFKGYMKASLRTALSML